MFHYFEVIGCLAGGQYACLNGGNCFNNNGAGVCQCATGYSGTYCGTTLGCNAGGIYACQNGGVCNSQTGFCQCSLGYSGSACLTCKWKVPKFKILLKNI